MPQLEGHGTILARSKLLWSDSSEESICDIAYRIPEATGETLWGCTQKTHSTTQNDRKPGVSWRFMNMSSFNCICMRLKIGNSPKAAAYFLLHNGLFHTPQHQQMPRHKTHLACDSTSRWLRNMVGTWTRDKVSESWNIWMLSMGIQHDMKPKGTIQHPKNLLNTSIYISIYIYNKLPWTDPIQFNTVTGEWKNMHTKWQQGLLSIVSYWTWIMSMTRAATLI
jgi:hypothetical protein